jgi:hypothetical protein
LPSQNRTSPPYGMLYLTIQWLCCFCGVFVLIVIRKPLDTINVAWNYYTNNRSQPLTEPDQVRTIHFLCISYHFLLYWFLTFLFGPKSTRAF